MQGRHMPVSGQSLVCWLALGLTLLLAAAVNAEIPRRLNYQGRLVSSTTGEPLQGSHNITYRIYDAQTDGAVLWSETKFEVADSSGVFSTILGSTADITVSFDSTRWLEIEVDGEILSPRREVVSVASAFNAIEAEKAGSLGGLASSSYSLAGHIHDDCYFTKGDLTTPGTINEASNPVDWTALKGVPGGFADGIDDVGEQADHNSLDALDGDPENAVYVDNDGKVGIGTTVPTSNLTIRCKTSSKYEPAMILDNAEPEGWNAVLFRIHGVPRAWFTQGGGDLYIETTGGGGITLGTNGTDRLRVTQFGHVGIGTSNPAARLHIHTGSSGAVGADPLAGLVVEDDVSPTINLLSASSSTGRLSFGDPESRSVGAISYLHLVDDMVFQTNGYYRMSITGEGDIGIGTQTPASAIDIRKDANDFVGVRIENRNPQDLSSEGLRLYDESGYPAGIEVYDDDSPTPRAMAIYNNRLGGDIRFELNNSELMRIAMNGMIGIGTVAPSAPFEVTTRIPVSYAPTIVIGNELPAGHGALDFRFLGTSEAQIRKAGGSDLFMTTFGNQAIRFQTGETDRMTITGPGSVGIGTADPSAALDVRGAGVGVIGIGGGQSTFDYATNSGVSATGTTCGVYGKANEAGNKSQAAFWGELGTGDYALVCHRATGGTQYRLLGTGDCATAVTTAEGEKALVSSTSPEAWSEDFGSGEIASGVCHVDLDPLYLDCVTVDETNPLKVFIQLTSPLAADYYVKKSQTGFDVVVLGEGAEEVGATFDYRVVGKRRGHETTRFESVERTAVLNHKEVGSRR